MVESFDRKLEYDSGRFLPALQSKSIIHYGNQLAKISEVRIEDLMGRRRNLLKSGLQYRYCFNVEFLADATEVSFGMLVKEIKGFSLGGATNERAERYEFKTGSRVAVMFRFVCRFLAGTYFANAGVVGIAGDYDRQHLHRILDAIIFRVEPQEQGSIDAGFIALDASLIVRPS